MKTSGDIPKYAGILTFVATMLVAVHSNAQEPIWDANTITLEKKELGPGVYGLFPKQSFAEPLTAPKPTSGGFIVGEKGILVVESFLNGDLAAQAIAQIRQVSQLPIKYVVNTSYHGDHSYGNYVFPSETAIIQHKGTVGYITEHFDADREFMMQYFGKGRGIEKAIPRSADIIIEQGDKLVIDLGGKTVEIHTFGFGQTPGDLYIWEPASKVMWVGNVWVAPGPGLPWLLDGRHEEVLATMKKIRDFLPEDATVVPGHFGPVKKEGLNFKIDYLESLHDEVAKAVKKGLTMEQTVAQIKMEKFRGYAIFDWVHFQVNVPATYKDLTQSTKK
jgi:glyoxylase-like metal-dependent hydrolase (beta-lactamase superfamily II)